MHWLHDMLAAQKLVRNMYALITKENQADICLLAVTMYRTSYCNGLLMYERLDFNCPSRSKNL